MRLPLGVKKKLWRPKTPHEGGRVYRVEASERWVWRCCICGLEQFWGPTWCLYGSILEEDAGVMAGQGNHLVACSEACKDAMAPLIAQLEAA